MHTWVLVEITQNLQYCETESVELCGSCCERFSWGFLKLVRFAVKAVLDRKLKTVVWDSSYIFLKKRVKLDYKAFLSENESGRVKKKNKI